MLKMLVNGNRQTAYSSKRNTHRHTHKSAFRVTLDGYNRKETGLNFQERGERERQSPTERMLLTRKKYSRSVGIYIHVSHLPLHENHDYTE